MSEKTAKSLAQICETLESKKVMQQAVELAIELHNATKAKKEEQEHESQED